MARAPCATRAARRWRSASGKAAARSTSSASTGTAPTNALDPETGQVTGGPAHVAFACAAMKAIVEVDVELGLTRVVWIGTAQDVGKAMNPQAVEGQIEGGTAQGLGPRADGGDPDARRRDHERELHRLPDPDLARHAAGRLGARRGSRSPTRPTA